MPERPSGSAPAPLSLPDDPNLDWLRKQAKRRLAELRRANAAARLADGAAAAGHLDVVRRLAGAGGDIVGRGDDHALDVIGWATCWDPCHDDVADFLVGRGARHDIFSAIAMNLADEVRRIVAAEPAALNSRLTRNDGHRTPLHHSVRKNRPEMVALLLDLGADPLAVDGSGFPAAAYATAPDPDRRLMERIREMTSSELDSAARGRRPPRGGPMDPDARWSHWDAEVTPLHLAAAQGHAEVVRLLLAAGADPRIRDSRHDGDAAGWAQYGRVPQAANWREIVRILEAHAAEP